MHKLSVNMDNAASVVTVRYTDGAGELLARVQVDLPNAFAVLDMANRAVQGDPSQLEEFLRSHTWRAGMRLRDELERIPSPKTGGIVVLGQSGLELFRSFQTLENIGLSPRLEAVLCSSEKPESFVARFYEAKQETNAPS